MHENYRYAFLLAFFALEDILRDYLRHLETRRGVSATKLKAYEKDIGMSYMINVELPMVTHPDQRVQDLLPDSTGSRPSAMALCTKHERSRKKRSSCKQSITVPRSDWLSARTETAFLDGPKRGRCWR